MVSLSVIIPVYNTEKYIVRCLDSIFNQSFKDFEVICVNDGSTDNSSKILDEYRNKHSELTVINKSREGAGIARNSALDLAKGEYILFADSDDYFVEGAFEQLINETKAEALDLFIFGAYTRDKNNIRLGNYSYNHIPRKYHKKIFCFNDIKKDIFKFPSTCWTKLYKRDFLKNNNIGFQDLIAGQDQLFFIDSIISASKIKVISKNLYCYHKNRPGATTSMKKKKTLSPIFVFYAVEKRIRELDEDIKIFILDNYYRKVLSWFSKIAPEDCNEFYLEFLKLSDFASSRYPKKWWGKFIPDKDESYIHVKFKMWTLIFYEKFFLMKYFLREL